MCGKCIAKLNYQGKKWVKGATGLQFAAYGDFHDKSVKINFDSSDIYTFFKIYYFLQKKNKSEYLFHLRTLKLYILNTMIIKRNRFT